MARAATRRRLKPADRREELLQVGEQVVRRQGPAARIEDVVAAAQVARGTFYVYFPAWEDFLAALRDRALSELALRFEAALAAELDWTGLIGRLPSLVVELTADLEGLHPVAFHGPQVARPRETGFDLTLRLAELLAAGQARGALDTASPAATAPLIYALLRETADRVQAGAEPGAAVDACQHLLLRALAVRPTPVRARDIQRPGAPPGGRLADI